MSQEPCQYDVPLRAPRPAVVWISSSLALFVAAASTILYAKSWSQYWPRMSSDFGFALALFSKLAFVWALGIGLFQRWRWSRWAACAVLAFLAVHGYLNAFTSPRYTPVADRFGIDPSDPVYRGAGVMFNFTLSTLYVWGTALFIFQPEVKHYFKPEMDKEPNQPIQPTPR